LHPDRAIDIVKRLNALGVDFAVEGMGTSSSWIAFMSGLPENTIVKVDRGFVRHVHTSSSDRGAYGFRASLSGIEPRRVVRRPEIPGPPSADALVSA